MRAGAARSVGGARIRAVARRAMNANSPPAGGGRTPASVVGHRRRGSVSLGPARTRRSAPRGRARTDGRRVAGPARTAVGDRRSAASGVDGQPPPSALSVPAAAGSSSTSRAPRSDGAAAIRPPWRSAIPAAIASPRPRVPRPARGRRTSSATGAGRPRPLSVTSIRSVPPSQRPRTQMSPPPCSIAFAIRLRVAWASRTRSPQVVRPSARPLGLEPTPARVRVRARGLDALRQQPRDVDRRPVLGCPLPLAAASEVLQGERRAAQFEIDRRAGSRLTVRRRATRARSRAAPR